MPESRQVELREMANAEEQAMMGDVVSFGQDTETARSKQYAVIERREVCRERHVDCDEPTKQ